MYAVIRTGGKQYKVAKDDVILVEKLAGDAGADVQLEDVLMIGDGAKTTVGTPAVEGASVSATVIEQGRGDKVVVFKKKRRQGYRRTKGHRQDLTVLRITDINQPGAKKAAAKKAAPKKAEAKADDKAEAKADAKPKAKTKPEPKAKAEKKAPAKKPAAKKEAKADDKKPAAKKAAPKKKAPAKKPAAKKKADDKAKE